MMDEFAIFLPTPRRENSCPLGHFCAVLCRVWVTGQGELEREHSGEYTVGADKRPRSSYGCKEGH